MVYNVIEYLNGESCNANDENMHFIVYWLCTNYSAVDWIVKETKQINNCTYQMSIESHFVC